VRGKNLRCSGSGIAEFVLFCGRCGVTVDCESGAEDAVSIACDSRSFIDLVFGSDNFRVPEVLGKGGVDHYGHGSDIGGMGDF
jgi:hypothetical protein